MDLKELIAKQRAAVEQPATESVDVVLGGELVEVTIARLRPDDWQTLVASHSPREGSLVDARVGYDRDALAKGYPAERIQVAGEPVDAETWADLYSALEPYHMNNVGTLIWGVNVFGAIKEYEQLGKAKAGQPSGSPANRASRRGASKGGSQRKSPRSSTTTQAG